MSRLIINRTFNGGCSTTPIELACGEHLARIQFIYLAENLKPGQTIKLEQSDYLVELETGQEISTDTYLGIMGGKYVNSNTV